MARHDSARGRSAGRWAVADQQALDAPGADREEVADERDLAVHAETDLHRDPVAVDDKRTGFRPEVFGQEREVTVEAGDRVGTVNIPGEA